MRRVMGSVSHSGSPQWMPMRTDRPLKMTLLSLSAMAWHESELSISDGQGASRSWSWLAKHHSSADVAVGNDTMKASPSVLTSKPPMRRSCRRITSLWTRMADRMADGYVSQRLVELLMSVNTIAIMPVGAGTSSPSRRMPESRAWSFAFLPRRWRGRNWAASSGTPDGYMAMLWPRCSRDRSFLRLRSDMLRIMIMILDVAP